MDDARRRVLARRAAFLAVATAGLHCDPKPEPQVCLSQVQPHPDASDGEDAAADVTADAPVAPPAPCLELAAPCLSVAPDEPPDVGPPDAGVGQKDAGKDAGKATGKDAGKPNPCLNVL